MDDGYTKTEHTTWYYQGSVSKGWLNFGVQKNMVFGHPNSWIHIELLASIQNIIEHHYSGHGNQIVLVGHPPK